MALDLAEGLRMEMGPTSLLGPYTGEVIRIHYAHVALVTARLVDTHHQSASLPRFLQELRQHAPEKLSGDLAEQGGRTLSTEKCESLRTSAAKAARSLDEDVGVQEVRQYRDKILAHLDYGYFVTKVECERPSIEPVLRALKLTQAIIKELHGHILNSEFSFLAGGSGDLALAARRLRLGIDYESALDDSIASLPHAPLVDPLDQWPPKRALEMLVELHRQSSGG